MSPQVAAFALTCVVEAAGAVVVGSCLRPAARPVGSARAAAALSAVLGSAATHPVVWWLNQAWALQGSWLAKVLVLELAASLLEAIAYRALVRVSWRQAVWCSLVVNALSFGVGLVLYAAGLLPT